MRSIKLYDIIRLRLFWSHTLMSVLPFVNHIVATKLILLFCTLISVNMYPRKTSAMATNSHLAELKRRSSDSLARHFNCAICYDQFSRENPAKTLPCGHTFCLQCVERLVPDRDEGSHLECPYCREVHQLPNGGADNFKTNYLVMQILDDFEEKQQGQEQERGRSRKRGSSTAGFAFRDLAMNRIDQFHNQITDLQSQADVNLDDVIESIDRTCEEAKERVSSQIEEFVQRLKETGAVRCSLIDEKASEEKRRVLELKTEVQGAIKTVVDDCKAKEQGLIDAGLLATDEYEAFQKELEQLSQTLIAIVKKYATFSFTKVEFLTKNTANDAFCLDKMGLLHEVDSTAHIMKLKDGVINLPRDRRINSLSAEEPRSSSAPPFERRRRGGIRRPSQDPDRRPSHGLYQPLQIPRRKHNPDRETVILGLQIGGRPLESSPIREVDEDLAK